MTVTSEVREFVGNANGSVSGWTFGFLFFDEDEVEVSVLLPDAAAYVVLQPGMYSITKGAGTHETGYEGGTVIYPIPPAAALPSGYKVKVSRTIPFQQTGVQLRNDSGFNPKAIEREFDRAAMRDQQLRDGAIKGVLRAPIGSTIEFLPQPETGKALGWLGNNLVNVDVIVDGEVFGIVGLDTLENVFVIPTIQALYVASYTTANFGIGGGLYRARLTEPSHPGKRQSLDGRWWELDEPVADITMFGATASDATQACIDALAYSSAKGHTPPVRVPSGNWAINESITFVVPLIMEGTFTVAPGKFTKLRNQRLDIRTYLRMYDDGSGDFRRSAPQDPSRHTRALQTMINDVLAGDTIRRCGGDGVRISINNTIQIDSDIAPPLGERPIVIEDFVIDCHATFPLDAPVFRLFSSSGVMIRQIDFLNNKFKLDFRGNGILFDNLASSYNDIQVVGNVFRSIKSYGIDTRQCGPGGGGLHIESNRFLNSNADLPFAERTAVGIIFGDEADNEVLNNRATYLKHFLVAQGGSHLIQGNHFFAGMPAAPLGSGINPGMVFSVDGRAHCVINGNYIDNGGIFLQQSAGANPDIGYITLTNNIFTFTNADVNEAFVEIEIAVANSRLVNIIITGNDFRNGGNVIAKPIKARTVGAGTYSRTNSSNVQVKDNIWRGGTAKCASVIEIPITTVAGVTQYAINTAGVTPFELATLTCKSIGFVSQDGGGIQGDMRVHMASNNVGTLRLEAGVAGRALVTMICQEGDGIGL